MLAVMAAVDWEVVDAVVDGMDIFIYFVLSQSPLLL
jgi:hypothetical protein